MLLKANSNNEKLTQTYIWATILGGGAVYVLAAYWLNLRLLDVRVLFIAILTLLLSSRIAIKIPQFGSHISVSDTFIFLTLLLYGCEAAILMAATEAFFCSFRSVHCRKPSTVLFNWAGAAWSVCITAYTLKYFFGDPVALNAEGLSARFITAVGLMALVQYATNSGLVAIFGALKAGGPIW